MMDVLPVRLELDLANLPAEAGDALAVLRHDAASPFLLFQDGPLLALRGPAGQLSIDWLQGRAGYRSARARQEKLVRACGVLQDEAPRVLDATPGLGMDAWLLAACGAEVILCEQNPVTFLLLLDAWQRAREAQPEVAARLQLHWVDSCAFLQALPVADVLFSAVYLDPMYPERGKAALGAASLRLLAELNAHAGLPHDEVGRLFAAARGAPTRRVVLKRPRKVALPAGLPRPGHSLDGRSTRFDVWRVQA